MPKKENIEIVTAQIETRSSTVTNTTIPVELLDILEQNIRLMNVIVYGDTDESLRKSVI